MHPVFMTEMWHHQYTLVLLIACWPDSLISIPAHVETLRLIKPDPPKAPLASCQLLANCQRDNSYHPLLQFQVKAKPWRTGLDPGTTMHGMFKDIQPILIGELEFQRPLRKESSTTPV